jgi:hypothetical protein
LVVSVNSLADVASQYPQPRERASDKIAKYVAIFGGMLAICAALGIPTQLGAFGDFAFQACPDGRSRRSRCRKGQGPSGATVTVTGHGFATEEIVDVRFHTEKIGEAQVGDDGEFSTTVTIPGSFDAFAGGKSFDISATGRQSGRRASQPFALLAGGDKPGSGPATISLSRGTDPSGTELAASGRNFTPGEEVKVRFATTEMGRAIADSGGGFTLDVRIPGNQDPFAPKQVDIVATGQQSAKSADAPFALTK